MKNLCSFLFGLSLVLSSNVAWSACSSDEYAQFDFWLGDWTVMTAKGQLAGSNKIEKKYANCVITETYTTPSGFQGTSINMYDKSTGQWHQTWADNTGLLLRLSGQLQGNAMVLSGPGKKPDGTAITHRITWTPNADNSVRQHWQSSQDNGQQWTTLFDGTYTKQQ